MTTQADKTFQTEDFLSNDVATERVHSVSWSVDHPEPARMDLKNLCLPT